MKTVETLRRENLARLVTEHKTQSALSNVIDKSPAQISQWLNASPNSKTGKPRVISGDSAREIEQLAGKPLGWMDQDHTPNVVPASIGSRAVPLISHIQAGLWAEIVDNFQPGDAEDWLMTDENVSSGAFALSITGNSMEPEFIESDKVIIDPAVFPSPGDCVAAKNGSNEATFKKYRPRGIGPNGTEIFELVPINPDYPTLRSDEHEIQIIGTMVEHRRYRKRK